MNARDPNYLKGSFRPQNLHLLTTKRAEATFGRTVLAHAEHFALEDGDDAADDGPPDAEPLTPPPPAIEAAAPAPAGDDAAATVADEAAPADEDPDDQE